MYICIYIYYVYVYIITYIFIHSSHIYIIYTLEGDSRETTEVNA